MMIEFTDDFIGIKFEFELNNVRTEDIEGNNAIIFDIKSKDGIAYDVLEWVDIDEDGRIHPEIIGSHIYSNQIIDIYSIFPQIHSLPQPDRDLVPVGAIVEAAIAILLNKKGE